MRGSVPSRTRRGETRPRRRGRARRLVRRGAATASVAFLVLALLSFVPAIAQQDDDVDLEEGLDAQDRPPVWRGSAGASAIHLSINSDPPILPFEELIQIDLPGGISEWNSSGATRARAATVYPGAMFVHGIGLMCEFFFPCPEGFPPEYPLIAEAQYPTEPDSETADGMARARANPDFVSTSASFSPHEIVGLLAHLLDIVQIETIEAHTHQRFEGATLVSQAVSRIQGLRIEEALSIDSIESITTSRADGRSVTETDATLIITGVSIDGETIGITDGGFTVGGQSGGGDELRALNEQLAAGLEDHGITLRVLGAHVDDRDGTARGEVAGLFVRIEHELEPLPVIPDLLPEELRNQLAILYRPYMMELVLGRATSMAHASGEGFGIGELEPLDPIDPVDPADDLVAPPDDFAAPPSDVAAPPDFEPPATAPDAPAEDPTIAAPPEEQALGRALHGGLFADRMGLIYLAGFAFSALTFVAARGLAAAARI